MRKSVIAALVICVSLLAQMAALVHVAAPVHDGSSPGVACHTQIVVSQARQSAAGEQRGGAPAQNDHVSCPFCQAGFAPALDDPAGAPFQRIAFSWRVASVAAPAPAKRFILNRAAPPRAPPSPV